ncbi:MAG: UDP-glucose 4-epimerase GalE, partial [Candidatus Brocadiia bacterium]|nr:UDP-glucose 4-epimerase GalE [Candidatus Brocadiia bacterium]
MRVVVTGGAGYIGSHAVVELIEAGHTTVVIDNLGAGHAAAVRGCELVQADLEDEEQVCRALRASRAEAVMHFAASAYVGESVEKPEAYYFNNVVNTLRLLRAARGAGVELFVFSSSCAVYGVPARVPITEDFPIGPVNPYGRTKATVEGILADYAAAYGLRYASLRYFNAAGAVPDGSLGEDHDPETHLIPAAIRAAMGRGGPLKVFGTDYPTPDGTCVRDYVHVLDIGGAHVLAMEALGDRSPLIYNLGTGRGHSVREVIDMVRDVTDMEVPEEAAGRRPGDPPELVGSSSKDEGYNYFGGSGGAGRPLAYQESPGVSAVECEEKG